jgi:ABC-type Fe3+-hydroxamate transport system substrate-binding protein
VIGRFVVDDLARPLALGGSPRRIVSLAPSATECLLALGAADRLVGVEEHSSFAELAGLPRVGGFKHVDVEAVLGLVPDLVLAAAMHAVNVMPRLADRGVPVFVGHPRTLDELVDGMARLAALLDLAAAAAPYLARCRARIATVVTRALVTRVRPLVYLELSPEGHTGGPQSVLDDLISKAGGVNLGGVARVPWPALSHETVRRLDPDVVVIASYPGSASAASLAARDGWDRIRAIKANRVWEIPAGDVKRPGPGLLDGLERLATLFGRGEAGMLGSMDA